MSSLFEHPLWRWASAAVFLIFAAFFWAYGRGSLHVAKPAMDVIVIAFVVFALTNSLGAFKRLRGN